jgi:hypothetical protein
LSEPQAVFLHAKKIHDHVIVDFLLVPAAGLEPAT